MKPCLAILILIIYIFADTFHCSLVIKRGVFDFARMIKAVTGRRASDYDHYGHYCGLGGSGDPVDSVDQYNRCFVLILVTDMANY
ncbi:hypothetical protein CHUAL_005077 [Chamberlinius hualienensis]